MHGVIGRQRPGHKQDPQTLPPAAGAANTGLSW